MPFHNHFNTCSCVQECRYNLNDVFVVGIDDLLARHYAHLFIRDPMTLFEEHIYEDDTQNSNHFEVQQNVNTLYINRSLSRTI